MIEIKRAAIYHFTDESKKRPSIYKKVLTELQEYAENCKFEVLCTYCDLSLKKAEHKEFEKFYKEKENYEVLIAKDFYHLNKNTGACFDLLQQLSKANIETITIEDGSFIFIDTPYEERLNVAIYYNELVSSDRSSNLQIRIFKMFVECKTNWCIVDTFIEDKQENYGQKELEKLIKNKNRYDMVITRTMNHINSRTSRFCKIRNELECDIFSFREGYVKYNKNTNS